ncbi:MAG: hypothetical protein GM46_0680 [actinobacterium acAcidi]|nr:MAG: hypothetical protein GM46_0680 [actinobacterium acAcidi]
MALAINTGREPQRQPRGGQSIPPERHLTVIPGTSKRTILFFSTMVLGLFVVVSSVIGLQAYIAGQQLKLDHLTSEISLARQYHDELRQQRVTLLAPEYLREQAKAMMMTPGLGSKFVEVPQDVVASVVISTGKMDPAFANPSSITSLNPLANLGVAQNEGTQP